ncbi:MAG: hypothetical protein KY456_15740 [Chloroflexi bacterium]|nr:hypothetical protein [Chloroflexota bacterium]
MVLPLVPLALMGVGAVTGAAGAVNAALGTNKLRRARAIADAAEARYERQLARTNRAVDATNARVAAYGDAQEAAREAVVRRMAAFIRRNQRQVSETTPHLLDGVEAEVHEISEFAGTLGAGIDWVADAAKASATGAVVYVGIPSAVGLLASASTGTAIKTLGGAAAQRATLAWMGGGSLATGGGGMAVGASALNWVTIGPTLLVTGLALNGRGEKATTQARAYEAEVDVSIEGQHAFTALLRGVDQRIEELSAVLESLLSRAVEALDELESEEFDSSTRAEEFQKAILLTVAVRDLIATKTLTENGELNTETEKLLFKYRGMK